MEYVIDGVDGMPIRETYVVAEACGLAPLVEEWTGIVRVKDVQRARRMAGLEGGQEYTFYHGTVVEKLGPIIGNGIKAFPEVLGVYEPRLHGTCSPAVAIWHAAVNAPHDVASDSGDVIERYPDGRPVLLVIRLPKGYVESHPDSRRQGVVHWVPEEEREEAKGKTRLDVFLDEISEDTVPIGRGDDCSSFGVRLPMDVVGPSYIWLRTSKHGIPHDIPLYRARMGKLMDEIGSMYPADWLGCLTRAIETMYPKDLAKGEILGLGCRA